MTVGEFVEVGVVIHGFDRGGQRIFLSAGAEGYAPVEALLADLARDSGLHERQVMVLIGVLAGSAHQARLCEACASRATN